MGSGDGVGRLVTTFGWGLLLILASLTHLRVWDWQSNQTIWTAATITDPHLPRPWFNLAADRAERGDFAGARHLYAQVLTLAADPRRRPYTRAFSRAGALANLARLDQIEGRHGSHAAQLRREFPQWPP